MSRRVANIVRVATLVMFAIAAVLALRILNPGEPTSTPEPKASELQVDRAIAVAGREPLTVRGYVFDGPGGFGLRLCNGRENTSPPRCLGPFLDLDGVNDGSFTLRSGTTDDGPVRWTEAPLALRGTILGTRMRVTQIYQ